MVQMLKLCSFFLFFFFILLSFCLSEEEPSSLLSEIANIKSKELESGEKAPGIPVFSKGENGYYCIKIPDLLITKSGVYIAFGEGRMYNCSDYTWTDLVYKRSTDFGQTWSDLQILYSNSTSSSFSVIGNAAPVIDRRNDRIIVPFCKDNLQVFMIFSDDDGVTWSTPTLLQNVTKEEWKWIGTGPPASLQLSSGRIITPSYHSSFNHYTDGLITHSHIMYSDDGGNSWSIGGIIDSVNLSNECQAVELFQNNTIMVNSRSLLTKRVKALSYDGGLQFLEKDIDIFNDIIEPLGGCEGSTILHPLNDYLFFSIPNNPSFLRLNMTVWVSENYGDSWEVLKVLYSGRSGYSALAVLPDNSVGILYETSDLPTLIFEPTVILFDVIWSPTNSTTKIQNS